MYEIFEKILKEKGVTAYKVGKETGIAGSTFTDWKNGRSAPKKDKLQKIADYFNVSIDYLMTGEESKFSKERALLEVQITDDEALMRRLKKYMELSQEKKDLILNMIDNL